MGVSQGTKALYHVIDLSPEEVDAGFLGVYKERRERGKIVMEKPTLDADANNICCKVASKVPTDAKAASTADYLIDIWGKRSSLVVVPCCDRDVRPDAKKASADRRADAVKAYIKAYEDKHEARKLRREVNTGLFSVEELTALDKKSPIWR